MGAVFHVQQVRPFSKIGLNGMINRYRS